MTQMLLPELTEAIARLGEASPIGPRLRGVTVEPDVDGDGDEFLRVSLRLGDANDIDWQQIKPLVFSIYDLVSEADGRFASIRFPGP